VETLTKSRATARKSRGAWWLLAGLVAAGLILIFWLPRCVPLQPTISDSYLFGYNNRAGVLLLLAELVLAGIYSGRLGLTFPAGGRTAPVSRRAVRVWMLAFLLACIGLWLLVRGLGGWSESRYMIDRLEALASGQTPYRDFQFVYGPLVLYGPRVLMLPGLSAPDAYYLFWTAWTLAGVWMLAAVINRLEIPGAKRTKVFHLICAWAFPGLLCTGANYSLTRYLTPVLGALLAARIAERSGRGGPGHLRVIGAAAAMTGVCLLLSPEMGIAFAIGMVAWLIFQLARSGQLLTFHGAARIVAVGVAESVLLLGAAYLGECSAVREFSAGAYSFPILPAGDILVFFFACGLVAVYLAWCLRNACADPGVLLVAAVCTPLVMAALGRCDPGHVVLNGIGIVLMATLLASALARVWQPWCAAFLLFVLLLPTATGLVFYGAGLLRVLVPARRSALRLSAAVEPSRIFPGVRGIVNAPFGYFPLGFGSWRSPSIDTGYYFILANAFMPADTERKIAELRSYPERPLLLPENEDGYCHIDPQLEARTIELLFALPWHETPRHNDDLWLPLCDYIRSHYRRAASSSLPSVHYSLWVPAGDPAFLSARSHH
jgi:hypothetical protein